MWSVQKVTDVIFFCGTNGTREVCCGREVEGTFMRMCGFFPPADSVSRMQPACEWVRIRTARRIVTLCKSDGTAPAAVLHQIFARSLAVAKWKPFRRFSEFSGNDAVYITQIKVCYNRFEDVRTSVESDARSGRPSTSQNDELIDQVRTLVTQDRRVAIRELSEEAGISTGWVHHVLTDDVAMR